MKDLLAMIITLYIALPITLYFFGSLIISIMINVYDKNIDMCWNGYKYLIPFVKYIYNDSEFTVLGKILCILIYIIGFILLIPGIILFTIGDRCLKLIRPLLKKGV